HPDVLILDREGHILYRRGRADASGQFSEPVVVNPNPAFAARDVAVIRTPGGLRVVALDARGSALSCYARRRDGSFVRTAGPAVPGSLPVGLAVGDVNRDGLDDLVVV